MPNSVFRIYILSIICFLTWSCDQGFAKVGDDCVQSVICKTNCEICTNSTTCTTCKSGFYHKYLSDSDWCFACLNGCKVCSNYSDCSVCHSKFYLINPYCYACPIYNQQMLQCATCTSITVLNYTICQSCEDHYFLNGNNCLICDASCQTCLNMSSACTSCEVGKYLFNSQCLPCSSVCSTCTNNSNQCTSCIGSNKILINSQCLCNDGYYIDRSDQCQICNSPCSKCEYNPQHCTECNSPFILSQTIQYKCECQFGYFSSDSLTCQLCLTPCLSCELNENHCLSCVDAHQEINELNLCVCQQGWTFNIDGITCIQCQLRVSIACNQQINVSYSKTNYINNQILVNVSLDGYKAIIIFAYLVYNHVIYLMEFNHTHYCETCIDTNQELNNLLQCVCKSTYYSDTLTTCAKCKEPCDECDSNGCISCLNLDQILDPNNQCVCKSGFVLEGFNCIVQLLQIF